MHLFQSNGWLRCQFWLNGSITASLRCLFLKYCRKNPKKTPFFRRFLAQKLIFLNQKCIFYYLHTFCISKGGYPVNLSSIGAIQQICEAFSCSNIGKPRKTRFFSTFFGPEPNFFPNKVVYFNISAPFKFQWAATF